MKKIAFFFLFSTFLSLISFFSMQSQVLAFDIDKFPKASINASCSGSACTVLDANSGRIFYAKNQNDRRAMASTTKIATAITVIDNIKDLDSEVTIPKEAVGIEGTSIYLRAGEVLTVRQLLYGLMLRSGNDAAVALAIHTGGSVAKFCDLMNEMVTKLGLKDTHFTNPHGLDDPQHYTSAFDLAKITAYALENEEFSKIVSTKNIKIPSKEEGYRFLSNKNRLLSSLEGCIGVKTGYTSKAGRCLVSAAERNGLKVVCVVLNCGPMFEESATLINVVYEKYSSYEILKPYQFIANIPVLNAECETLECYSKKDLRLPLSKEEYSQINIEYDLPEFLPAPVKNNQEIGEVKVYYSKHLIFSEKIYTIKDVGSKLLKDKVKEIIERWEILN